MAPVCGRAPLGVNSSARFLRIFRKIPASRRRNRLEVFPSGEVGVIRHAMEIKREES
jgi:hypothetical protein